MRITRLCELSFEPNANSVRGYNRGMVKDCKHEIDLSL